MTSTDQIVTPLRADGPRVAVIVCSTRPTRICPGIAASVQRTLQTASPVRYELVDLAEIDLPMLDEPLMAALESYAHDHTRAWSALIDGYRGFVFVLPQYNWGYPAVFKNALDYLYREWHDKPATTVTYGTRGGSRAAEQVGQLFGGVGLQPLEDRLLLKIGRDDLDEAWQVKDLDGLMAPYAEQLRRIDAQMTAALDAQDASPGVKQVA